MCLSISAQNTPQIIITPKMPLFMWKQKQAVYVCVSFNENAENFTVKNIFKICYHKIFSFVKSTL